MAGSSTGAGAPDNRAPSRRYACCLRIAARSPQGSRTGNSAFRLVHADSVFCMNQPERRIDRKSTRLNSSHQIISYAVFCLKKKKESKQLTGTTIMSAKPYVVAR